jgi:hypothetical protein
MLALFLIPFFLFCIGLWVSWVRLSFYVIWGVGVGVAWCGFAHLLLLGVRGWPLVYFGGCLVCGFGGCHSLQGLWLEVSLVSGLAICCSELDKTSNTK